MRLLFQANTNDENGSYNPGDVADIPDEVAIQYVTQGWALRCDQTIETTEEKAAKGRENAMMGAQAKKPA